MFYISIDCIKQKFPKKNLDIDKGFKQQSFRE